MRRYFASRSTYVIELAAITLLALLFVSLWAPAPGGTQPNGLNTTSLTETLFNPTYRQTRLEHERLAGVLYPVKLGLGHYGHVPTWNPYLSSGEPFINDAFSYLFNPFHSLPVLLSSSYIQGTKLAMFIALLIAGFNMWTFAGVIGVGAIGRVLAGALYMTSGGIAGKFFAGHFQLALSLAWPPLVLAALWCTMKSSNRFAPAAFGLAFALLFFAGNIYYVLHTLLGCALIVVIHLFDSSPQLAADKTAFFSTAQNSALRTRHLRFRSDRLRRTAIAAVFAFGLAAIQFVPIWMTRDYVIHDNQGINPDGSLDGSYSLSQALANLTYPWPDWNTFPANDGLAISVDYAYIGATPFLLIVLALAALLTTRELTQPFNRAVWIASILALVMMIWGSGQNPTLEFLYNRIPLLAEFRFIGRVLSIAALWWILLAAIAADLLWKAAYHALQPGLEFVKHNRTRLLRAMFLAMFAWAYFLFYSLTNTSTRLAMVLYDTRLLLDLDRQRFTSFVEVVEALWTFLLVGIVLDTALIFGRAIIVRWRSSFTFDWRGTAARLLQISILAVAFMAIGDSLIVNSRLYQFEELRADFSVFYPFIRASDPDTPFPAINQPYAPSAFSGYEHQIRNWGLDEGWKPAAVTGIIPRLAGGIPDLPRWAIVSGAYGGTSHALSEQFVTSNGYEQRQCAFINQYAQTDDPCDLESQSTAILYEKPDVLPYAFVVLGDMLVNTPTELNATNVFPAQIISHQQDTITIQAGTPDTESYFLIVQEIHFPGWQVTADGIPLHSTTAEIYHDVNGSRGFIAIPMPAGVHTYNLRFEPPGFTTGMLMSLVTVAVIAFYLTRKERGEGSGQNDSVPTR